MQLIEKLANRLDFLDKDARDAAIRRVNTENPSVKDDFNAFLLKVTDRFVEEKLARLPEICEITRVLNRMEFENIQKNGKKGKYTESYGWSEDGSFKFEYHIPQTLHLFMVNFVHPDFWDGPIWRKFMKKICEGHDAMDALCWAKAYYGSGCHKTGKVLYGADNRAISK